MSSPSRILYVLFIQFHDNLELIFAIIGQDVGTAQLIIDGKVGIKHGVEISRCTKNTLIFSDGSELEADVLIFAYVLFTPSFLFQ